MTLTANANNHYMRQFTILSLLTLLSLSSPAGGAGGSVHLYVSPDRGQDSNPGTKDKPFATLQFAVSKLQPGDTLFLRGGTYRETVTFPRSGTAEKPITVKAYAGEKVVVTGCEPVSGWTKHKGNIWKAPMNWTLGPGRNQIFYGGEVMIEARFPNQPAPGLEMPVSGLSKLWPTFGEFSNPDPTNRPQRLVSQLLDGQADDYWKGAIYYGIHYAGWTAQTGVIESSRPGEITVGHRTTWCWSFGGDYVADDGRGMIVGHMNALDEPGEWHWQDNMLFLIPPDGAEPAKTIEAKHRQLAFDLGGREHIHLNGLRIVAASMKLTDSAYCVVDGCDLSYLSHFTRVYGTGQVEHGRDTIKSGETGIFMSGHDNSFLNCSLRFSAGAGFHIRGYHHTIHNCLIDEVNYASHYLNAITDAVDDFGAYENFLVGGHAITFNTMRNAGRHFFNFYGNGTSVASRNRNPMDYAATLFAHNHLYNGMLQTRDAGFLTSYQGSGDTLTDRNSQIIFNVLHDSYDLFAMEFNIAGMIYLDQGTWDVDLHHNLLWAAPGSAQQGIWYNTTCVDIREGDNLFHKEFTRTCAELKPEDFPGGKPFRFGHDFQAPPPRPQWPQIKTRRIEAESCRSTSPGLIKTVTGLTGLKDGDWFALDKVDLRQGWQSAVIRFASDDQTMNTDRAGRTPPRHRQSTDPLVLDVVNKDAAPPEMKMQWTFCYNVEDGAWVKFEQVPLGEGYRRFRVVYGNVSDAPRHLEVRLDRVDGPLVGRVALPRTDRPRGQWIQLYQQAVGEISAQATGTHDVFVVFHSDDKKLVAEFEYFRFEQYRGAIPLQKNEVKLEVRVGAKDGEKIGEFYPRFTGGADVFRDMVVSFEPGKLTGKQPLYFVVRSATGKPIGTIDRISVQKSRQPMDLTGLGIEPLRRDGHYVFPDPTHRPLPPDIRRLPWRLRQKLETHMNK